MKHLLAVLTGAFVMVGVMVQASQASKRDIFAKNDLLARSVNFGNILEAPGEGDWGLKLEENYFQAVKDAGFTAIRLPVRWSSRAQNKSPFTIDAKFMDRVAWAVKQATTRGLSIIINVHHYEELNDKPSEHLERFLAIWRQVAVRFKNESDLVFFEVLNEPNGAIAKVWNDVMTKAINVIRESNPTRALIVGPTGWNSASALPDLKMPQDSNLIVTFHHYTPFEFTHQGAGWVNPVPPVGTPFPAPGAQIRSPWANWSWETTVGSNDANSLTITFKKGYAGFYLHRDSAFEVERIRLRTDRAMNLNVTCAERNPGGVTLPSTTITTRAGADTEVTLQSCGNKTGRLGDLMLMNNSAEAQPVFTLSKLELIDFKGQATSLMSNSEQQVLEYMQLAFDWGKANKRPIFMGEFGAYEPADMASRVRWTKLVRETAERMNMTWAYWEFASGFGVYDPKNSKYKLELTQALLPGFKP
jgi:endoglucanase